MRKRKKHFAFIIPIFLITLVFFYYAFFFKFKEVSIEPKIFSFYLTHYFLDKTPYQIYLNLKEIMIQFPEIKKIEIKQNVFQQKLEIKVETTQTVAKICDSKNCFYLDNTGRIILPKTLDHENLIIIFSNLPIEKDTLLSPELIDFLAKLFEYSNLKPFPIKKIIIHSNFDLSVFDEKEREFLFDPLRDIEEQIKKLHLFLTKDFEATRIDLRIHKKIYFK